MGNSTSCVFFCLLIGATIADAGAQSPNLHSSEVPVVDVRVSKKIDGFGDPEGMRRLKSYFSGGSWEEPISDQAWSALRLIDIKKIRLINIESQEATQGTKRGGDLVFNFASLLPGLADCRKYHLKPHLVIGGRPQAAIAYFANEHYFGIRDYETYDEYAYALLKFVTVDQGFDSADFEIGNEPDINGTGWLLSGTLPAGDRRMYEAYLDLYRAWSTAAARLRVEYPSLSFRIGGPDITPYTLHFGSLNWASEFIKDVAAEKLRLDFFSFHFYGNNSPLDDELAFGPYPSFSEETKFYRSTLSRFGLGNVPIYVTEWGARTSTEEDRVGIANGSEVGAAWSAKFVLEMLSNGIEEAMPLILRDHVYQQDRSDNWGWPGFLLSDGTTPKALYNVARMFLRLPERRLDVSANKSSLSLIGAEDSKRVDLLVVNENWDYSNFRDRARFVRLNISFSGLEKFGPEVQVVRYSIDSNHSNAYLYHKQSKKIDLEKVGLQRVSSFTVRIVNGTAVLPLQNVLPTSVSLWELSPRV